MEIGNNLIFFIKSKVKLAQCHFNFWAMFFVFQPRQTLHKVFLIFYNV